MVSRKCICATVRMSRIPTLEQASNIFFYFSRCFPLLFVLLGCDATRCVSTSIGLTHFGAGAGAGAGGT